MKFKSVLLTAFAFIVTGSAFAKSDNFVVVNPGQVMQMVKGAVPMMELSTFSAKISHATLFSNGILVVTPASSKQVLVRDISDESLSSLTFLAEMFSSIEVKTTRHLVVCEMVYDPRTVYSLSVSSVDSNREFTGKTRVISTLSNCAVPVSTLPVKAEDKDRADSAVLALRILANELLEDASN